jgi:ribosomal protein S1
MLKVGDVVDAEVTNVQVFGILCRHCDEEILVLIPETSWIASCSSCRRFAQLGDKLRVKILHIDVVSRKIAATIKGQHPNPWQTDELCVGVYHHARIVRYVEESEYDQPGYLIELVPGGYTMLYGQQASFVPGDHVSVIIQSSNPEKLAVDVAIAKGS